jgi:hypothetical protein
MKFYTEYKSSYYFWDKIANNKLSAVYYDVFISFFKNGKYHNNKHATNIYKRSFKDFYLNGEYYCNEYDFTKQSWRIFVKLKAFL